MTLTKGTLAILVTGGDDLSNMFTSWALYVLVFGLMLSYFLELTTMAASLQTDTAAMSTISLMVICEESSTILGGLFFYEEWQLFSPHAAILVAAGNSIAVVSVVVMCLRRARSELQREARVNPRDMEIPESALGQAFASTDGILITVGDVGPFLCNITDGIGLWVNYILALEREQVLHRDGLTSIAQTCGAAYSVKSIRAEMQECPANFLRYCEQTGIRAIVPTTVEDCIFVAEQRVGLNAVGVEALVCEDSDTYYTLDHKWLSYSFCQDHDFHQPDTLPLRQDTQAACRDMVAAHFPAPCFIKKTFHTWASRGVTKVCGVEQYDKAVAKITLRDGLQLADVPDREVQLVVQKGDPGSIFGSQSIWYLGRLVSAYIWKENTSVIENMSATISRTLAGKFGRAEAEPSMFKVESREIRDEMLRLLGDIGRAANYTGMMDIEFVVSEGHERVETPLVRILEFNPRFSGGVHAALGSGFLEDYMSLLVSRAQGSSDEKLHHRETWPLVRSDGHEPRCRLQDYNVVQFYAARMWAMLQLRSWPLSEQNK